jgi:integrase
MQYDEHIPAYSHHKPSGQAKVTINGRTIYLGTHGTAASRAEYNRLVGEWLANGRQLPPEPGQPITINKVMLAYNAHVAAYYRRPDGTATTEVNNIKYALKPLRKLYGTTPAPDFGPLKLIALQNTMVEMGWTRNGINKQIGRIKQFFKWAVSRELIPASVHHAIATVRCLAPGRSAAEENKPVRPAPQANIDAALPLMPSPVRAMVKLQLFTGARPGELTTLRMADLDMSGKVWRYKPTQHKTLHHGHDRVILFGPHAQAVLKDFLTTDTTAYLFSPAAAMAERRAKATAARTTPLSCGNRPGTNRKQKPKRLPGNVYDVTAYNRAIRRACDAAGVQYFHAHQLRHNSATSLREEFGVEAAKTILGHRTLSTTLLYAEDSLRKAEGVMLKVG